MASPEPEAKGGGKLRCQRRIPHREQLIAERDDVEIILAAVRSLERLPQSLETLGSTRYCHDA